MHQESVQINCPNCGEQLTYVSPQINRQVKELRVEPAYSFAGESKGWKKCPNCNHQFFTTWIYTDTTILGFWDWFYKNIRDV